MGHLDDVALLPERIEIVPAVTNHIAHHKGFLPEARKQGGNAVERGGLPVVGTKRNRVLRVVGNQRIG